MDTFAVPFNFLDLEDPDEDDWRSVEQAARVAAQFQSCANVETLGSNFLSSGPDRHGFYIQVIRFTGRGESHVSVAWAFVDQLARQCRQQLAAETREDGDRFS